MFFLPAQLPEQLPALNAFAKFCEAGSYWGSFGLIKVKIFFCELNNNYPNNYPPRHHWEMRSKRVVVRVVVLEGKASVVPVSHFLHVPNKDR